MIRSLPALSLDQIKAIPGIASKSTRMDGQGAPQVATTRLACQMLGRLPHLRKSFPHWGFICIMGRVQDLQFCAPRRGLYYS